MIGTLFLQLDRDHFKGLAAGVLRQVFQRIKVHHLAGGHSSVLDFAVRKREPETGISQENGDRGRMTVHHGLLSRSVLDPQDADGVVFEFYFVVSGST
jgi:hypothetical protein